MKRRTQRTVIIPGNLLLFGEYAVTREKGLGIALATRETVKITVSSSCSLFISGTNGHRSYSWTSGETYPSKLLAYLIPKLKNHPPIHIHIDSSELHYACGRKKGFGASAAITIGLISAMYQHIRGSEKQKFLPFCIRLHREFQGGMGSGYDILASYKGGAGLIEGGRIPKWTPMSPKPFEQLFLVKGEKTCITNDALRLFEAFLLKSPGICDRFVSISNKLVKNLSSSLNLFHLSIMLNQWINKQLSIESFGQIDSVKPLGAGGELGLTLKKGKSAVRLQTSQRGIYWKQ